MNFDKSTVIVLGAKPDAKLPDINPKVVITANNAVLLASFYREKFGCRVVAVINSHISTSKKATSIKNSLIKSKPDEVVFLGKGIFDDHQKLISDELGLGETQVTVIEDKEITYLLLRVMGFGMFQAILFRLASRGLKDVIFRSAPALLLRLRTNDWMALSTGLYAIMYALDRFPKSAVVSSGVSLQAGQQFNNVTYFTEKTSKVDRMIMNSWPSSRRIRLFTTDMSMEKLGGVKRWEESHESKDL